MTPDELSAHLSAYAIGIESELAILRQIEKLAVALHEASRSRDVDQVQQITDERDRIMASLVRLEHQIRASRHALSEHRAAAAALPGYDGIVALHRAAGALVTQILSTDEATRTALRDAEIARRAESQALEAGEQTLAAYKRVLGAGAAGPALVDRRG